MNILKYTTLIILILSSCTSENISEKFDNITIDFVNSDDLFADSLSSSLVTIDFGQPLPPEQEITLTTSKGALYSKPFVFTSDAVNTLNVQPFSESVEVLLVTNTLEPTREVFFTATINDFSIDEVVEFQSSIPEDLIIQTPLQIINESESIMIRADLFKESSYSSNGIRFNLTSEVLQMDTSQNELQFFHDEFVLSNNNQIQIPLTIVTYSTGSEIQLNISFSNNKGDTIIKNAVVKLE